MFARVCPFFLCLFFSDFVSVCLSIFSLFFLPLSLSLSSFFPYCFFSFLVVLLVLCCCSCCLNYKCFIYCCCFRYNYFLMSWFWLFYSFVLGFLFVVVLLSKKNTNPRTNNPQKRWKDFRAFWTWPVMFACAKVIVFLGESRFFLGILGPKPLLK